LLEPLPCLEYPIGAGKKGNILIRKKDNKLALFDLSTGMIDEIGVRAGVHCKKAFFQLEQYIAIFLLVFINEVFNYGIFNFTLCTYQVHISYAKLGNSWIIRILLYQNKINLS
jgi:hypothetical protein